MNANLVFLYDGACGICRREAERLRDWSRHRGALEIVDISAEGFDPSRYGRTLDELMGRVHAVRRDGTLVVGMDAIHAAYQEAGMGWLMLPTRWPLLRSLFDRLYLWFARNRYAISDAVLCAGDRCGPRRTRAVR